jgi:O-antigen/teichoic acid export membrane protein
MLAEACSSVVAFAGIWLIASFGARVFLDGEASAELIRLYAPLVLCNLVFESASGVLQAADRFRLQAQIAVAGHVAKFAGIVIAAVGPGSVRAFLLADLAGQAVTAGAMTVAAWHEASRQFGTRWWRSPIRVLSPQRRAMVHFAVNTNVSGTFSAIHKNSEPLLIGYFRSSAEAGYFNLALRLLTLAMRPIEPMAKAIYPESTRQLARGDTDGAAALWRKGSMVAAAWIVPASVGLAASSFWLIPRLFGESFSSAAPALCLLLPGIAISHAVFWVRPALLALGLPGYATLVNVGLGVVKIGLSLLIVPLYGYLGSAGLATALTLGSLWLLVRKALAALAQRGRATEPESQPGAVPSTPDG